MIICKYSSVILTVRALTKNSRIKSSNGKHLHRKSSTGINYCVYLPITREPKNIHDIQMLPTLKYIILTRYDSFILRWWTANGTIYLVLCIAFETFFLGFSIKFIGYAVSIWKENWEKGENTMSTYCFSHAVIQSSHICMYS